MNVAPLVMASVMNLPCAAQDNNVEWAGISHVAFQDRRPLCPLDGEPFSVLFKTWANDLTSAGVWVDDGVSSSYFVAAQMVDLAGPYDVWQADVPATTSDILAYHLELTDGLDTDYFSIDGMREEPPIKEDFILDFVTLNHAPLGATPHPGGGTIFKVWAPTPTSAYVRGAFNSWGLGNPMTPVGDYWTAYVSTADPGEQYKFYFEPGAVWKQDARARGLNPADNLNGFIKDPFSYAWISQDFPTPAFEDMIIYELHVGTFSGRNDGGVSPGTYRQAVDKHVDHLVELGINVVELTPPTEFPWDYSGGYNPISMWAPEWKWGSPDDLKYMIDVLHQNGIAVIVDIVWNHFSPTDNFMWYYDGGQVYFDEPAVETPWGSQCDFDKPEVQDYYADSSLYWLEEFRIDGYRMDATDFMNQYQGSGWGLMQRFNNEIDNRYADKIAIAEQLPDDPWVTRPVDLGGAGFDSQWHDKFVDNIRQAIFDAAFGNPQMTKVRDAILGSGEYMTGYQVVNYIEAHDEAWPDSGGQRMVVTIDPTSPHDDLYAQSRTKLGHALAMFSPGIPMFLQGCEFLESTGFGSDAPGSYEAQLDWSKPVTYAGYLQFFKDMIAVRKSNGALRADGGVEVSHLNDTDNVVGFHRWDYAGNDIFVVVSFKNSDLFNYNIGFPQPGTWFEILNSQSAVYGGTGVGNGGQITTTDADKDGYAQSANITVPQMSVIVFRYEQPAQDDPDLDLDGDVDFRDFGLFQRCFDGTDCGLDADFDQNGVVDLTDFVILQAQFTGPQ